MKLLLVTAAALVALASCKDKCLDDRHFHAWKHKFGKSYNSSEETQRKEIWLDNYKYVLDHNILAHQDNKSFHLDMNHFADMTNEEFKNHISKGCLAAFNPSTPRNGSTFLQVPEHISLPNRVDWREKGYVTPVKDQQQCGSCWAFSATGALEGQHFRKTGHLVSLSEQQLVDCSGRFGNRGCHGGYPDSAFWYILVNGGINTESTYPYTAQDGECRFNPAYIGATVSGFVDVPHGSEIALMQAVATVGPVSVAIDASSPYFQMYHSGIYDDPTCSFQLNHAVLVVGYGSEGGKDYWLVKNSWGTWWGDRGYIKMARNRFNQCGIANLASYPLV